MEEWKDGRLEEVCYNLNKNTIPSEKNRIIKINNKTLLVNG